MGHLIGVGVWLLLGGTYLGVRWERWCVQASSDKEWERLFARRARYKALEAEKTRHRVERARIKREGMNDPLMTALWRVWRMTTVMMTMLVWRSGAWL